MAHPPDFVTHILITPPLVPWRNEGQRPTIATCQAVLAHVRTEEGMAELRKFLILVWKHWKTGLNGSSLTALLTILFGLLIVLKISGYKISAWAYAVVVSATLFNAFFSVWRDAYRSYRAEPFRLLAEECLSIHKFVATLKNPDPKQEFYLVSPAAMPDNGVPLTEDIRNVARLMTRLRDFSERINGVFASRGISHSGPIENWWNERGSITHTKLLEMLEGERTYLERQKQEILRSSKPTDFE
jgi:hypothetical protein